MNLPENRSVVLVEAELADGVPLVIAAYRAIRGREVGLSHDSLDVLTNGGELVHEEGPLL